MQSKLPSAARFVYLPIVLILLVMLATFAVGMLVWHEQGHSKIINERLFSAEKVIKLELKERTNLMSAILSQLSVNKILSETYLQKNRELLLNKSKPIFDSFYSKYDITHFYFLDTNRKVRLRVHMPNRHGDIIDRFTLLQAEATHDVASGIELGPLGTLTLRVVQPWWVEGKLVGYIELGQEIDNVIDSVNFIINGDAAIAVRKEFLDRAAWEDGMRMVGRTGGWNRFDRHVFSDNDFGDVHSSALTAALLRGWNIADKQILDVEVAGGFTFKFLISPFLDAADRPIGKLILFTDITGGVAALWKTITIFITACIISGIILSMVLWLAISRFGRQINKAEQALQTSIDELEYRVKERTRDLSREVSERKQMAKSLVIAKDHADIANQAKSKFLANMSHELRTPLNAIIGFSEVMENEVMGPIGNDQYREYVKDIHESGRHLLSLISDILDLSKIEAGAEELHEENIDVTMIIGAAIRLEQQRAKTKDIELDLEVQNNLPPLRADERKMKQILINLLTNAIKFTDAGGKVTLRAWCHLDSGYVFQIVDTGIGIAPEEIPKVLTEFGQANSGIRREIEGTGLGLPLTKALVELHGGSLDLQSEVGVGTIVTARFPKERIVIKQLKASSSPAA